MQVFFHLLYSVGVKSQFLLLTKTKVTQHKLKYYFTPSECLKTL